MVIDGAAILDCAVREPDRFLGEIPVALSFHATKSFATGEGGAVASTSPGDVKLVTQALNFGFYRSRNSAIAGTNGKMSEYHAAVGLAKLDGWAEKQAALRGVADEYRRRLAAAGLPGRFFGTPDVSSTYAIFLCGDAEESSRVQEALGRHRIDFRPGTGRVFRTRPTSRTSRARR